VGHFPTPLKFAALAGSNPWISMAPLRPSNRSNPQSSSFLAWEICFGGWDVWGVWGLGIG